MKTKQQVEEFFATHQIDTGGAITKHEFKIEQKEDGDTYCKVTIPVWSNNDLVVRGVLQLLQNVLNWDENVSVCFRDNCAIVYVYERCWNGAS